MLKPYFAPTLVQYGSLAAITGEFGGSEQTDTVLDEDGNVLVGKGGSIPGCAFEPNGSGGYKCICSDNGSC